MHKANGCHTKKPLVGNIKTNNYARKPEKYKIKLASNSPRRRELLSGLGVDYEVKLLPGIDETYPDTLKGEEIPIYIAREKADAYRPSMQADELIITADTIVYIDGEVLGKPKDEEEACQMLRKLSGRSHQVITGVCLTTTEFQNPLLRLQK